MTQQQDWGRVLHRRIAAAIRNARQGRISAQELADETERLGYPVSRSQVANYESGRKQSLDVAELLVLAAALDIPPALLLFPTYPSSRVMEVIPGYECDAKSALEWLSGETALPTRLTPQGRLDIPPDNDGTRLVRAVGELEYWELELLNHTATAKDSDDAAVRAAATRAAEYAERRVAETEREIADLWTRLGLSEGEMGEIGGKIHGGKNE